VSGVDIYGGFAGGETDLSQRDPRLNECILSGDLLGNDGPGGSSRTDNSLHVITVPTSVQWCFAAHGGVPGEVDPQAIYDYMYFGFVPSPGSVHRDRTRLLAGEYALWRGGRLERAAYWEAKFEEDHRPAAAALEKELLLTVRGSVERAVDGAGSAGAFLSGGLDSSTVAGMLARVAGKARTYSMGFDAEGFDEMVYARAAAKHFGTDHHEYYVTPDDVVAAIPDIARVHAEPFGNESAVPTYLCAKLASDDGVDRLLAGDGGDEIFGGNERYSQQLVFGLYERIPAVLRKFALEPLLRAFPFGEHVYPVRRGRGYVRYANMRMPDRLQFFNFLQRTGPENVFEPAFLVRVDRERPIRHMRAVYDGAHARTMVNRMLALDLKYTLADNDLPKVTRSCELAGVDVVFPMLDEAMVAFAARLGVDRKVKIGKLRPFMRHALRDFLPPEVLTKSKHGFGLPFGVWLRAHAPLQELARDSLGRLRERGIFLPSFLDRLADAHAGEHATYYGVKIWHLMMLEQWYRMHVDGAARPVGQGAR
jgi:asparagine synthase (glutamine-hydrolysing)